MFHNQTPITRKTLENGFLKISAKICKEGVFEFNSEELNVDKTEYSKVKVFYPYREFANSQFMDSFKETPVIIGHHDVSVANSDTIVGHVIGEPVLNDGGIVVELLIENASAIEQISDKSLQDVSLLFDADCVEHSGTFVNEKYDYEIKNPKLKHIALLPPGHGRMGTDVRIYNEKTNGVNNMEAENETKSNDAEQLTALQERCAQLEAKLKEQSESLGSYLSEAIEDRDIANEIASFGNFKCDTSLIGSKLHEAVLAGIGVETKDMDEKQLKAAFKTASVFAKTARPAKTATTTTRILANSKPIARKPQMSDMEYYNLSDDEYELMIQQTNKKK